MLNGRCIRAYRTDDDHYDPQLTRDKITNATSGRIVFFVSTFGWPDLSVG